MQPNQPAQPETPQKGYKFQDEIDRLEFVTVCSIEPNGFRKFADHLCGFTEEYAERNPDKHWLERRRTLYVIKPADAKLGYSTVRVYGAMETYHDASQSPSGREEDPEHRPGTIYHSAGEIANSLVTFWGDVAPGKPGKRGIGIIAGNSPTPAELAELKRHKEAYCYRLVNEADEEVAKGNVTFVAAKHREAVQYLGMVRDWGIATVKLKNCPACKMPINEDAQVCKHCGTNLLNWYEDELFTMPEVHAVDPVVAQLMQQRAIRKARAKQNVKA